MPVFALWSAPRARSTAFFRSMVERGDLVALHEPFCNMMDAGETDVDGQRFDSAPVLLDWLREETGDINVFLKDATDRRHDEILADQRFLTEERHAFLIRRPEEIATSFAALRPEMDRDEIGLEALHEMYRAVVDAGGHPPVVVDSDDLVSRPAATMAAYCEAVGLPFLPEALTWESGDRPEWRRSARWHTHVAETSGFRPPEPRSTNAGGISDELARFAAHHQPFYEQLRAARLDVGR